MLPKYTARKIGEIFVNIVFLLAEANRRLPLGTLRTYLSFSERVPGNILLTELTPSVSVRCSVKERGGSVVGGIVFEGVVKISVCAGRITRRVDRGREGYETVHSTYNPKKKHLLRDIKIFYLVVLVLHIFVHFVSKNKKKKYLH